MKQATPERKAERPYKNLSQVQEELADLASDILLNGGAREDVDMLLTALLRHERESKSHGRIGTAVGREEANKYAKRFSERYYLNLAKSWPKEESPEPGVHYGQRPERPVTEMVRANIREKFMDEVEEFLA